MSELVKKGDTVSLHYTGKFDSGETFDSSHDRGQTLRVVVGTGQLIPGFDAALEGMEVGKVKTVTIPPEQAYGPRHEGHTVELPKTTFPEHFRDQITEGSIVPLSQKSSPDTSFPATATEVLDDTIVFDLNHPTAGKELTFDIEIVGIGDDSDTEGTDTETEVTDE